ncbi:MAG: hypothetical protein AABZ06_09560, partial [Bdellovibrionota bacterium]
MNHKQKKLLLVGSILAAFQFNACNIFDPVDNPSGDIQNLSAARACFDQGDFECATEHYGKLSSSYSEIASSELAFKILDENGATMGAFMSSFGKGLSGLGPALTKLTSSLYSAGGPAGVAKRLAIFNAFKQIDNIPNNIELRGMVRFVTATVMAAELLAEDASGDGVFRERDLVADPSVCEEQTTTDCLSTSEGRTACAKPSGKNLVTGTQLNT